MIKEPVWIQRKMYFPYDEFDTWDEAIKEAKQEKKRNKKIKHWILIREKGTWFPRKKYMLFLTHVQRIIFP